MEKYKHIEIDLSGVDGNAFMILASVSRQAKKQGLSKDEWAEIRKEATSGDYNHLLITIMKYFDVDA